MDNLLGTLGLLNSPVTQPLVQRLGRYQEVRGEAISESFKRVLIRTPAEDGRAIIVKESMSKLVRQGERAARDVMILVHCNDRTEFWVDEEEPGEILALLTKRDHEHMVSLSLQEAAYIG